MPPGLKLVGFSDDITFEAYGKSIEEVELTATHLIGMVEEWMRSMLLESSWHKTAMVVVNNRMYDQPRQSSRAGLGVYTGTFT